MFVARTTMYAYLHFFQCHESLQMSGSLLLHAEVIKWELRPELYCKSIHFQTHCFVLHASAQVHFIWCFGSCSFVWCWRIQSYEIQSSNLSTVLRLLLSGVNLSMLSRIFCFGDCILHVSFTSVAPSECISESVIYLF